MRNAYHLIAETIRTRRSVFLFGAGISAASGVPLVGEFIEEIGTLAEFTPPEVRALKSVQFEYLLARISDAAGLDDLVGVFKVDRPTLVHQALASLHQLGYQRDLITTNFDLNFEAAFRDRQVPYRLLYTPDQFKGFSNAAAGGSTILKLHGSAHEPVSMKIFGRAIAGRSQFHAVRAILRELLSGNPPPILLVAGYSMSDRFDITPVLEELQQEGMQVLFWRHRQGPDSGRDIEEVDVDDFLNGRLGRIEIAGDTRAMFASLMEAYGASLGDEIAADISSIWRTTLAAWWEAQGEARRHRIRASLYLAIGRYQACIDSFEEALARAEHDRSYYEMSCSAGNLYNDVGQYDKAIALLDRVLNTEAAVPRYAKILALVGKARALILSGYLDEGMKCVFLAHVELTGNYLGIPEMNKGEIDPDEGEADLWVAWLLAVSGGMYARGDFGQAVSAMDAAADLAEKAGLLLFAHKLTVDRARLRMNDAIQREDEEAFFTAHGGIENAVSRYAGVFHDGDQSVQSTNEVVKALNTLADAARTLGWQGFLAFLKSERASAI